MNEILRAREYRVLYVRQMIRRNQSFVITIKANIPGPNKNINAAHLLVRLFLNELRDEFESQEIIHMKSADGPYVLFSVKGDDGLEIKKELVRIEDKHPLGRYIDLDLYISEQVSLSRFDLKKTNRKCFICGKDAHICSRNMTHSIPKLIQHIKLNLNFYIVEEIKRTLNYAILAELELDDKFGLVTKTSSGSHQDMDYDLMVKAKNVIMPYFIQIFNIGYEAEELVSLLDASRYIGIAAEDEMLQVTKGVNCYKGLIFVMGLTLLAAGYALARHQSFDKIFDNIRSMSFGLLGEFNDMNLVTFGKEAYQEYKITGVRGEAYSGFPSIRSTLELIGEQDIADPKVLRNALKHLIINTQDTVLLKRAKSLSEYEKIKHMFASLDVSNISQVRQFTQYAIKRNLSFGGSADLLVATVFLNSLRHRYF
jgi:holo-ACP synthase / triphosphoribosyl-dephospho-CoA synthase